MSGLTRVPVQWLWPLTSIHTYISIYIYYCLANDKRMYFPPVQRTLGDTRLVALSSSSSSSDCLLAPPSRPPTPFTVASHIVCSCLKVDCRMEKGDGPRRSKLPPTHTPPRRCHVLVCTNCRFFLFGTAAGFLFFDWHTFWSFSNTGLNLECFL